jgi:lipopolysaccharide heptosyltransferase I
VSVKAQPDVPRSLLVIRLGAVGDVIRTLPAVSCLRGAFPEAKIGWAVEEPSREILQGHPDIDEVHVLARRQLRAGPFPARLFRGAGILRAYAAGLREASFDWAVDLHGTFKSGLIARLSGARRIYGFGRGHAREHADLFYTDPVPLPRKKMSRVERALAVAGALGAEISSPRRVLPEWPDAARVAERFLREKAPDHPRILISPGTSETQSFKRYPAPLFARFADAMVEATGGRIILAWGPGEESIVEEVRRSMSRLAVPTPRTSLTELAEIARRCDLFVGSDTGPLHLAAATGIPVVALYGPTDPKVNAPYTVRPHLVLVGDVSCRPCRNKGCRNRSCLWRIDPELVARRSLALLDGSESTAGEVS